MTAPGGRCDVCGNSLHWRFDDVGELWTSCPVCLELEFGGGPEDALAERREEGARRDEDLWSE